MTGAHAPPTVVCALHVHSTFSDGEFTLAELREKYLLAGCSVVGMADHGNIHRRTLRRIGDNFGYQRL